ncbi:hypothetical protein FG93_05412 [Bosea sp. LC85]|uniref:hypothetical protein n=1 Tax=Bosea sp. LC85 TaxID=1502851 RepID=UPI0004E3DCBE|nr:hypothetical protein [Bosea sp. LC85]KFC63902.1 hypothetical protein FG93_05412 [Bosea sp. LC85]
MFNWIIQALLALAGIIAAWFVAPSAPNFDFVQMVVALLLLTVFVALAAFWPTLAIWRRSRRPRDRA